LRIKLIIALKVKKNEKRKSVVSLERPLLTAEIGEIKERMAVWTSF